MQHLTAKWEKYRYIETTSLIKACLFLLPMLIYVFYVYTYAINIPRQDDFDAILDFLISFKKATSFSDKFALIFQQHNEHRIFSSRLMYAIYYSVTGTFNFRHIILLNGITIILVFTLITNFARKMLGKDWYWGALALSLCIFDLNNFENADFAMAGMQNYGVILLFLSAIYFYDAKARWNIIPAVIAQALCVFSSGNGNIGAFLIVLFVLFSKDKLKIAAAVLTFIIFAPLYYYHYNHAASVFFTTELSKVIPFFLHAVGSHFSYSSGVLAGMLLLVILLVSLPIGKNFRLKKEGLPLLCLLCFILLSMAVMATFRAKLPIEASYASRYFIYSHMLAAIAFVFMLASLQGSKFRLPVLILTLPLLAIFYKINYKDGKAGFIGFHNTMKTVDFDYPDKIRAKALTDEACGDSIYCIDKHRND